MGQEVFAPRRAGRTHGARMVLNFPRAARLYLATQPEPQPEPMSQKIKAALVRQGKALPEGERGDKFLG